MVIVKSLEPFRWAETRPGCGQDHCIRHPHSSVSEWRGFKVVSHTSGKAHTQERCFSVASKEMLLNSDYCVLGMGTLALMFTGAHLWRPETNIRFCETGSELGFSCHCLHGSCHACQQAVRVGRIHSICPSGSTFCSLSNPLCPSRITFMDCLYGFPCPLASTCFWPM